MFVVDTVEDGGDIHGGIIMSGSSFSQVDKKQIWHSMGNFTSFGLTPRIAQNTEEEINIPSHIITYPHDYSVPVNQEKEPEGSHLDRLRNCSILRKGGDVYFLGGVPLIEDQFEGI
jgi:hypothetical protein